ncbi:MAG: diguanylate cyclase (GGDEF)-like protein [Pseudohongiellaceae bacterium]|jgi:diguanylate cyclase (GGDEF)-like protein
MFLARFSINLKLLLLLTLPLVVLIVFLSNQGKSLYDTYEDSHQTETIIAFALKLENVAHQHATERGLTEGFLTANGTFSGDEMLQQRKKSDQAVDTLREFIDRHKHSLQGITINTDKLIDLLRQKDLVRDKVDQFDDNHNAFKYYSLVNKKAIDSIDLLTTFLGEVTLRSELNDIVSMLWLKERAGQSRGALNGVYAKGSASVEVYIDIHTFINDYNNKLEALINKKYHNKAAIIELAERLFSIQINIIQNNFLNQLDQLDNIQGPVSKRWFALATQRIESIRTLIDEEALYILNQSQQIRVKSQLYLLVGSIVMTAVIVALTLLSYYISLNVSSRIRNINTLLTRSIKNNDLSIKIDEHGDDEITCIAKGINRYINWQKDALNDAKKTSLKHEHSANHDPLTSLANRNLFFSRLTHLTKQLHRYDRHHAILYIDLDFFKKINDKHGHYVGDKVLQLFAQRLVTNIRTGDTAARLGGDEFAVILEEITSEKAQRVSQKLLNEMEKPFLIDKLSLNINISIGMTFFPTEASQDAQALLQQADHALYEAKVSGRQQYRYFDSALKKEYEESIQLENDLENAIKNQAIFPYFQPQYCLKTQKIIGLEALARWQHPEKGFVAPSRFIPLAQRLSLITLLTESIMKQAGTNLLSFIKVVPDLKLAINISGSECSNPHILHLTQQLLTENHLEAKQVELEVTESILIEHAESSIEILTALHDLGVSIAIDNFGAGYSSLGYLTALPIDILKIDMSFVQGIGINRQQEIVIKIIIDLAKKLSLGVLAEGIETQAQADFLIKNGCDYGQGYFYSKPCSAQDIDKLLSS